MGDEGLASRGVGDLLAVAVQDPHLVVRGAEHPGADVVEDQQVGALAARLLPGEVQCRGAVPAGLGGEAPEPRARRPPAGQMTRARLQRLPGGCPARKLVTLLGEPRRDGVRPAGAP